MFRPHKHRSSFWAPRRVPVEPVEIDWSHPLSSGLIGCYVPGTPAGLQDLTGIGPALLPGPNGFIGYTPEGRGYSCNNGSAAAYSTVMPPSWMLTVGGTLFWRGICTGNASTGNDVLIWGNLQNASFVADGSTNPPYCYAIKIDSTGLIAFGYGAADTNSEVFSNSVYSVQVGHVSTVAVSFVIGGAVTIYAWGGSDATKFVPTVATGTWSGAAPDYTLSPQPSIGCDSASQNTNTSGTITQSAYLYNRALSAQEVVVLDADPFSFLRPVSNGLRAQAALVGHPYRRWNRTYLVR